VIFSDLWHGIVDAKWHPLPDEVLIYRTGRKVVVVALPDFGSLVLHLPFNGE